MSYVSEDPDPRRPRRGLRGPLTVTVAALVPVALVGWLVWRSADGGTAASGRAAPTAASSHPAAPGASGGNGTGGERGSHPAGHGAGPGTAAEPLKGKVVAIDPGHNPGNRDHTAEINRPVNIGTNRKECDTTGTATNDGYPEARFTLDVSRRVRALLEAEGATVVLTQDGDRPWGPCVDERAEIGNDAHADAAVSIHADGSAAGNRGFHVILPKSLHAGDADTRAIAGPSRDLGERMAGRFVRTTRSAPSNYVGGGTGLDVRGDLGGLNLSTVPKVMIECANMRDPEDAALVRSSAWRQKAAEGISEGIMSFLGA